MLATHDELSYRVRLLGLTALWLSTILMSMGDGIMGIHSSGKEGSMKKGFWLLILLGLSHDTETCRGR